MSSTVAAKLALRMPRGSWIGGYFAAAMMGLLALGLLPMVFLGTQTSGVGMGAFLALLVAWILWLARYGWRDARAKHRLLIGADDEGLSLRLPPGRSLAHKAAWCVRRVPWSQVVGIDTRLEAYSTLGMANMQRAFALRLQGGERVLLGEDRALGTQLARTFYGDFVAQVAERFGVKVTDLGMAEGRAGLLGVLFTAPPSWDAGPLPPEEQSAAWRRVGRTALFVALAPLLPLIAALL